MYKIKNHPLLSIANLLQLGIRPPFSSSATPTVTETFSSMRNYNLVPEIPSWNRLLHHFNSAGLVDQEKVKEFVAEKVQESDEGIAMDSVAGGAFVKIIRKQSQQVGDPHREFTGNYKHKRELGKGCH